MSFPSISRVRWLVFNLQVLGAWVEHCFFGLIGSFGCEFGRNHSCRGPWLFGELGVLDEEVPLRNDYVSKYMAASAAVVAHDTGTYADAFRQYKSAQFFLGMDLGTWLSTNEDGHTSWFRSPLFYARLPYQLL